MDRSSVQDWLDRYVAAWKSYDQAAVESLFAENATYRYHPYDTDFLRSRAEIVKDWLDNRDAEGTYDAHYEPFAIDGDRAVAVGWSHYFSDRTQSTLDRAYDNVYLMRFDPDGRCADFTEYFMKEPDKA